MFNPAMPLDVLDWVIEDLDLILLMSVNPGFGGQSFIDSTLRKIEAVRKRIDACGKDIRLEVDGGIKEGNIRAVANAGADTFVAGSAVFGKPDYKAVIDQMRAKRAAGWPRRGDRCFALQGLHLQAFFIVFFGSSARQISAGSYSF